MSDKSDEISDMSEGDVSEGAVTNEVFMSQVDPSLSQIEALKSEVKEKETKETEEVHPRGRLSPQASSSGKERPRKFVPSFKFDPNTFDYTVLTEPQQRSVRKTPSANIISRNIKSIKNIPKARSLTDFETFKLPAKKSSFDIEGRFYDYKRKTDEKLEKARQEKESELQECTFQPFIYNKGRRRSMKEYYADVLKYQKVKTDRVHELREIQKEELSKAQEFPFKPSICEKSRKITTGRVAGKCFERLYSIKKTSIPKASSYVTPAYNSKDSFLFVPFAPKVSKAAKDLVRGKNISNLLYEDALRRMKQAHVEHKSSTESTNHNSINLLVKGFLSEFEEQRKIIDVDKTGRLNYTRFINILKSLKFYREKPSSEEIVIGLDIWAIIAKGTEHASIQDLKVMLMGIMGYHQPWMESHSSFVLTANEVAEIHDKYSLLFKNRSTLSSKFRSPSYKKVDAPRDSNKRFQKKPTKRASKSESKIESEKEVKIENKNENKTENKIDKRKQKRINDLRAQMIAEEIKECASKSSFSSPNTHPRENSSFTRVANERMGKTPTKDEDKYSLSSSSSKFEDSDKYPDTNSLNFNGVSPQNSPGRLKRSISMIPSCDMSDEPWNISIGFDELINFKSPECPLAYNTVNPRIFMKKIT